jgi:uncharacterized protein GlcG (DUF336 family)
MTPLREAPPAWKIGTFRYGSGLTLAKAKRMLEAGEKEANKQEVPMAMAISDSGGILLAFHRMDNTMLASVQIAIDKAYTAVLGKIPTGSYQPLFKSGELIPLFFHERWITFHGGYPLIKDGIIMGGLGVSGGVIEDCYVARAIMKTGGFSLTDLDEFITSCEAEATRPPKVK